MASPAAPHAVMLPPTPCTIYLCTPAAHPIQCTFYALTRDKTITHLLSSHTEIASYRAAYGDLGLRALPIEATLQAPSHGGSAQHIFVCFCCRVYFPLESTLLHHLADTGFSTNITDMIGEEGLRNWVRVNCRRRLVAAVAVPVIDHAQELMNRFLQPPVAPPVQITVHNNYRAVNFNGSCTVNEPAAVGVPIRLFFTWPLTRANPLITLTSPSAARLQALVVREYEGVVGPAEAAKVDWDARMAKGVVVRYDKLGGGGGACVVRRDEDLEACWEEMEFAEAFVGDRRTGGV